MEQEAKLLLFKRLDACLKEHTTSMFLNNAQPDMKDIYDLQQLAELHYHLKFSHPFTPAEVEALLSFKDPLNVAQWCWEENTHAHSFPICELLQTINADKRFEKSPSESREETKRKELIALLGQNLYAFQEKLQGWSRAELIDRCEEIAATMAAYKFMAEDYRPTEEEIDYLLRYDDPLGLLCSYWPECSLYGEDVMETLMDDMSAPPEGCREQPQSLRKRLQKAAHEVKDRPAADSRTAAATRDKPKSCYMERR